MNIYGLLFALLLPLFVGFSWLNVIWRDSHWSARVGYGYLLGVFILTLVLQIWGEAGYQLNFILISTFIVALAILPYVLYLFIPYKRKSAFEYSSFDANWQRIVWMILLVVVVVRCDQLLEEVILRPLYPWDAWMNWAPKAKTWFSLKEMVPFVSPYLWATHEYSSSVYTLGNPDAWAYPPLVPLLQTWMALGMGGWIDNLINLPWFICLLALGLSFYGQGRMLGLKPHVMMVLVYALFSLPFVNTHVALAGYADIWLASYLALAGMAFINWSYCGDYRQAFLLLVSAIACTQTKIPGVVWIAIFIPGSLFIFLSKKRWAYFIIIISVFGVVLFLTRSELTLKIGDLLINSQYVNIPGLGRYEIIFHDVSKQFFENDFLRDNWHLMFWLVIVVLLISTVFTVKYDKLIAPSVLISLSVMLLLTIFSYTKYYLAAIDGTTINRATLHIVPLLLYYAFYVYKAINGKEKY